MAIFQTEIMICATAYVQAATAEEAHAKLAAYHLTGAEVADGEIGEGISVCGSPFNSDELPEVSLSPAMTIYIQNFMGAPITPDNFEQAD